MRLVIQETIRKVKVNRVGLVEEAPQDGCRVAWDVGRERSLGDADTIFVYGRLHENPPIDALNFAQEFLECR